MMESGKKTSIGRDRIGIHPGQYYDGETGLHYNWNRYYDSGTGRYQTIDPIGFNGGGENFYQYGLSDPNYCIDPQGLRIQLMGSSEEQKYILDQLNKFTRGKVSIDQNGMLVRDPCGDDENIESSIDELIKSGKLYRIYAHLSQDGWGRSSTAPTIEGADIFFDPNTKANYRSGGLSWSTSTPASDLAHEILGRAIQIERGEPTGPLGSKIRDRSNQTAVNRANPAYIRMGMKPRIQY